VLPAGQRARGELHLEGAGERMSAPRLGFGGPKLARGPGSCADPRRPCLLTMPAAVLLSRTYSLRTPPNCNPLGPIQVRKDAKAAAPEWAALDMNASLAANGVADERAAYEAAGLPAEEAAPTLHLYWNDDLTVA
jgi:hypothetical protein